MERLKKIMIKPGMVCYFNTLLYYQRLQYSWYTSWDNCTEIWWKESIQKRDLSMHVEKSLSQESSFIQDSVENISNVATRMNQSEKD